MRVTIEGLSHRYAARGPDVLRHVDIEIESGESVALVGPSGSGKTTLLSLIGGLETPTSGTLAWDGTKAPQLLETAWIFQGTNALGRRTTLDNCSLTLLARGFSRSAAEARSHELLEQLGIAVQSQAPAFTLSGGELQRLSIARALSTEPQLLLADEPTGQLDASNSDVVLNALFSTRPESTTLICATHDMNVAERCSRSVQIVDGQVLE